MDGLKLTIYNKAFQRRGWIGNPVSVTCTVGFNIVGKAEVTFAADHPKAGELLAEGARLVIEYESLDAPLLSGPVRAAKGEGPSGQSTGWPLLSGPVRAAKGEGPSGQSTITVTVEDDLRLLWRVLGWQVPTAAIGSQGTAEYRTYTGNAETIVKTMVTEQAVTRLGLPVTVASNLNRGAIISGGVKVRMHPLADRLFPAVEQAGLGVRCYQSGAGLLVDVYEPRTYSKTISEQAGTLSSWSWASAGPRVTRVVGGGQGEGTARVFRSATDTTLEALYGDVIEGFADARNGETTAEVDQSNTEVLFEGKPTSGLALTLSETPYFRYGTVQVGDRVTISAGGHEITDVLRSATLSWTRQDGLVITPAVGEIQDSTDSKTARAIKALWQGLTQLKVR